MVYLTLLVINMKISDATVSKTGVDCLKQSDKFLIDKAEVEFVHSVSAGGSVKFLPAV